MNIECLGAYSVIKCIDNMAIDVYFVGYSPLGREYGEFIQSRLDLLAGVIAGMAPQAASALTSPLLVGDTIFLNAGCN